MSAPADIKRDVRCLRRTARGLPWRRAKDRSAGGETQALRRDRFYTFAPADGESACDWSAAPQATRGDRSGRRKASMYDAREPRHPRRGAATLRDRCPFLPIAGGATMTSAYHGDLA